MPDCTRKFVPELAIKYKVEKMYRSSVLLQKEMQVKGQLRAATTLHPKQRPQLPLVRAWANRYGPYVKRRIFFLCLQWNHNSAH
jgi:hypothetical protein